MPAAVSNARAGADLLAQTASRVEAAYDGDPSQWDAAARTADQAYDTLASAFLLAGGS